MKHKKQKASILSLLLSGAMVFTLLPTTVFAAGSSHNINEGAVTIDAATGDCSEQAPHVITGGGQTSNTISVTTGTHYVRLENVNIAAPDRAPAFLCDENAEVYLNFTGANTLQGGSERAGIAKVKATRTLTIGTSTTTGTLNATGGAGGAGIGGNAGATAGTGNIVINGGTVNATGGSAAAGIGGGTGTPVTSITINGGTVTATGGEMASGIGVNAHVNPKNMVITFTGENTVVKAKSGLVANAASVAPVAAGFTVTGGTWSSRNTEVTWSKGEAPQPPTPTDYDYVIDLAAISTGADAVKDGYTYEKLSPGSSAYIMNLTGADDKTYKLTGNGSTISRLYVSNNCTVTLDNITLSEPFDANKGITLILADRSVNSIEVNGSVAFSASGNTIIKGTGSLSCTALAYLIGQNGISVTNSGTLTIEDGAQVTAKGNGYGMHVGGTITFKDENTVVKAQGSTAALNKAPAAEGFTVSGGTWESAGTEVTWSKASTPPPPSGGGFIDENPAIVVPPSPDDKPNAPVTTELKTTATVDNAGNGSVSITEKNMTDAVTKALEEAKKAGAADNGIAVQFVVSTGGLNLNALTVNLPKLTQEKVIDNKVTSISVIVEGASIAVGFDLAALTEINKQANSDVQLTTTRVDNSKLAGEAKTAIGNRPVFDVKATYDSGSKSISGLGSGQMKIEIAYKLQKGELAENLYGIYVDGSGKLSYLANSSYDAKREVLIIGTGHNSVYGVGYKASVPAFTDINGHWAKDSIDYVAARGILSGTGSVTFSPNIGMTRAMFVTALGRLAGIDSTQYKNTKFDDVTANAYYNPYVAWATEKGITKGVSATAFSPDSNVTRQEMAVFMVNFSKAMGYTLPESREELTFADTAAIADYAQDAVKAIQIAGIIVGKSGNMFDPTDTATRAEVATVLRNYMELVVYRSAA